MNPKIRRILLSAAIVAGIVAAVAVSGWWYINAPFTGSDEAWIYLPQGTTTEAMADSLELRLGHPTASRVMRIYRAMEHKAVGTPHGAYRVTFGTSARNIAQRLLRHRQTPVKLTFNNIRTFHDLAERVGRRMELTPEQFAAAADSILPASGFRKAEYAAAFLPDTYEFYWTTPANEVVKRLLAHRNDFWNDDRRRRAADLGLTPVKVAIISSIAEEETNSRDERATVGRLYLNRVRRGMKLQADPTVKFAVGDFSLRRIRGEHLRTESPYNTYIHAGLPPGPIRIPEARTMDDFLNAPDNDYIYMCAKEDFSGRHNFASDYATHRANARRYREALDKRNIK